MLGVKTVYLIRHCKAEGQEPNAKLTSLGESQANELAQFLKGKQIDTIGSSPFNRAVSTIRPFAKEAEIEMETDERLAERVLCSGENPNWPNMLERSFNDPELAFEGGESGAAATKRGLKAINAILAKTKKYAAVVTHGNLMALILKYYDESFGFEEWKALSNPDVYEIRFEGEKPEIHRVWG
ncbi:histidine phosphatase family protein [Neobacillus notoginsengisoli]|uniref:Histidine phosphatase family protein n=1 Tax=Neobacillus notoginsengisoli TaxID=1578198 RepID=A0A417YVZ2_9BACI|nr:histidine phosphatase family protein [Neobacillus notoginsengisoli]RHW41516.1 histidine phosphatase family protein [Neobacillus notoginsengisoli]